MGHRYLNPNLCGLWQFLIILAKPSAPAEPSQRAFNHPSARQHIELVAVRAPAHHPVNVEDKTYHWGGGMVIPW